MTVSNPSFETPGLNPGTAEDWDEGYTAGCESIALFSHYDGYTRPYESFEQGWGDNHYFQLAFAVADIVTPLFSDGIDMETFEYGWSAPAAYAAPFNNSSAFEFSLDLHDLIQFNSGVDDEEDFESGWDSNENFVSTSFEYGGSITIKQFDTVPEGTEDFEEEWRDNDSANVTGVFFGSPTDLTITTFDPGGDFYEDFDAWTTVLP